MWNDVILVDSRTKSPEGVDLPRARVLESEVPWRLVVLVVDDDRLDTWLIERALRDDNRIRRIICRDDPAETLAELSRGEIQPNMILLDIHMPKLSGFDFLDSLNGIPTLNRIPVVLLTTSRQAGDVEQARRRNVKGYVIKPDRYEELRSRLNGVLTGILRARR